MLGMNPGNADEQQIQLAAIAASLAGVSRLGVAYSGGVDSAVMVAAAVRILGVDRVVPILGRSASLAPREREQAHAVAEVIGVPVVEVDTYEMDNAAYRANGPDRCFHCKDALFTRISDDLVSAHALDAVAYGENADDARRPDRPGAQAATNHRVLRPLADAGLGKADVRALARAWSLPCADKPAAPCLASRIPHFLEVTPLKLAQIDRAEAALHELGFQELRVRHHGDLARVELGPADLTAIEAPGLRARVDAVVREAGFDQVAIDPAGLQSGAFTLAALQVGRG